MEKEIDTMPTRDTPVPARPHRRQRGALQLAAMVLAGTVLLTGAAPTNLLASVIAGGPRTMTTLQAATVGSTQRATPSRATQQAIQAVIEQANAEQQQAYAENNTALLQAMSTAAYAAQLIQT
jgi:hypothetical protein